MAFDRTLISIRERQQIDLFDLALVVIRRRPKALAVAATCGIAPFVALNAWFFGVAGAGGPFLSVVLWWFEAPIATAPLTLVLGAMMFDRTPSIRSVARQFGTSSGTLFLAHVLLRFVPVYWLPPRLVFANEIILLEHAGWLKLWKRGASLTGGRDGDLFFLAALQAGAILVFAALVYLGLERIFEAVTVRNLAWDFPEGAGLTTLAYQIPIWLGVAFFAIVRFLTYIDQRIRLEGWEIKLRLFAAGEALAEARRW